MHNLNKKLVRRGEELLQKAENRHNLMVEIANYAKKKLNLKEESKITQKCMKGLKNLYLKP